jgi:hypothetical protein
MQTRRVIKRRTTRPWTGPRTGCERPGLPVLIKRGVAGCRDTGVTGVTVEYKRPLALVLHHGILTVRVGKIGLTV